jgi:MFS family permease
VSGFWGSNFLALRNRNYRLFALGQSISVTGTWMQKVAQAWLVLELTDSAVLLGVTVAMQQLPTWLLTTVGGGLADRFEKRTILRCTTACGVLPAFSLGLMIELDAVHIWMVMLAALVQGTLDAVEKPSRLTLVNDIAGPEVLTNAVALNNIIQDSGKLVGPALAGILITTTGTSVAFFANAVSYVFVFTALTIVRPLSNGRRTDRDISRTSLREVIRYVGRHPPLTMALVVMSVAGLFAYNFNVIVPLLTRNTFGGGADAVGYAFTAMGLGGVLGGLALAGHIRGTARRTVLAAAVFGLVLGGLSGAPSLAAAYVLLFLAGLASVAFRATTGSFIQLQSERQHRGRVVSLYILAVNGTSPLGAPLQGWICGTWSPRIGLGVGAIATLLAAAAAYRFLHVREQWTSRSDPPPEPGADAPGVAGVIGEAS